MNMQADLPDDSASAAELERNGEAIRADMNRTLDELERKLSPGQLLDRSLGYLRDNSGDFVETLGRTVRENPMPVIATAVGLLWMFTSRSSSKKQSTVSYGGSTPNRGIVDKLRSTAADASQKARSIGQQATDKMRSTTQGTTGTATQAWQATRNQAQRARDSFQVTVDEQPLVVGAIGLAVGALVGAAVPATAWENRTMGQLRDKALERAKAAGANTYEEMRGALRGESGRENAGAANGDAGRSASSATH
jgi:ElaB/YqjD/DUF883 family membrane-anchored ribosome-binding protein